MTKFTRMMTLTACSIPLLLLAQTNSSGVNLPQDKGPDKIDVSAYPAPMQAAYKLFTSKCSKCHTIARPMNTAMPVDDWSRYVKRMMHKPNSGISDSQGKQIFEFLSYDQENRKDKNPKAFFPALSDDEIAKLKAQQAQ
jgi:mono/diheme cytochrome c family protein